MKESHIALYRKYRPQSFDQVVGQDDVVHLLQNAIKQKKISHAYLFAGGRGTGKTTVARIVAREIGCNEEDIIEIDAASNRGIEEIRELREAVRTAPFSSPYKVYILDEAHMLTKEAANALLKTLEEPPAHIVFILATTDPQKLPQTIVSRTQKVLFQEPTTQTLAKQIRYVADKEGFSIDDDASELIARHGKGSYRDALGVLEQILAVSSKKISDEKVRAYLGEPDTEQIHTLIRGLCEKDVKKVLETTGDIQKQTVSASRVYDEILSVVRLSLLVRAQVIPEGVQKEWVDIYTELAQKYPHTISSKTIIELLKKRELLNISPAHEYLALEAVLISLIEE